MKRDQTKSSKAQTKPASVTKAKSSEQPTVLKQSGKTYSSLSIIALLVALASAVATGILYWQQYRIKHAEVVPSVTAAEFAKTNSQLASVAAAVKQLEQSALPKPADTTQQSKASVYQHIVSAEQAEQLRTQLYVTAAKINVELAQTLLMTRHAKETAITLLQQAKRDLAAIGGKAVPLTNLLAQASHQIMLLPEVKVAQLKSGLQSLNEQLAKLALKPPVAKPKASEDKQHVQPGWRGAWQHSWQKIKQFLVIRRDDHLSNRLLYESDRLAAWQTIRVYLMEARMAVWQGNQSMYQQALVKAQQQVKAYTQATPAQAQWLKQAQILVQQQVSYPEAALHQSMVQLTHSLQLLNHLLDSQAREAQ